MKRITKATATVVAAGALAVGVAVAQGGASESGPAFDAVAAEHVDHEAHLAGQAALYGAAD